MRFSRAPHFSLFSSPLFSFSESGRLFCWSNDFNGQLTENGTAFRTVVIPEKHEIAAVTCNSWGAVAATASGGMLEWTKCLASETPTPPSGDKKIESPSLFSRLATSAPAQPSSGVRPSLILSHAAASCAAASHPRTSSTSSWLNWLRMNSSSSASSSSSSSSSVSTISLPTLTSSASSGPTVPVYVTVIPRVSEHIRIQQVSCGADFLLLISGLFILHSYFSLLVE